MSQPKCKFCKNDIWRVVEQESKAYCENCNADRSWYPRKRRVDRMTPSQIEAIKRTKRFFTDEWQDKEPKSLSRFSVTFEIEFGTVFLFVETAGNIYARRGGMFHIRRRGRVECLHTYGVGSDADTIKHYNYMLRRK